MAGSFLDSNVILYLASGQERKLIARTTRHDGGTINIQGV